jgi:hypothetical protein
MSNAGNTPNFTAASTVQPFSCVKVNTTSAFQANPATAETDVVVGITDGSSRLFDTSAAAISGGVLSLQNGEFVQLTAGGTITVGDGLRPSNTGTVVTANNRAQFVACESAASGEIFWGKKIGAVESVVVPGVYGSSRVGRFLLDATTQTDSVDIIIAGDSNTNYSGWGWADGLNFALQTNTSALEYATPITPTTSWDDAFYYGVYQTNGAFSKINAAGTVVNPAGSPALGGTLAKGITSGPAELTALMNRGSGNLQPNTSPFDYGWIASGDWADPFGGVLSYQDSARMSWTQLQIFYRVVHGKGPSMGTLRLASRLDDSPNTSYGTTSINCNQATYEWVTSTLTIPADSAKTNLQVAYTFAANNNLTSRITGPMAVALNSICTPRKGYAVTCISHHGGANMDTVASNVVQAAPIVRQYLKEARSRQIACGGSGRVIVCIQGGCNAGVNPWGQSATTFFEQCATEWAALGYPSSDLAFLGFVSHQENDPDDMTAERSSAIALATSSPQYTIVNLPTLVSFNDMTYGGGSNVTWFANASTERIHLSESGYKAISGRIISALLASA